MASTNVSCEPMQLSNISAIESEHMCFKYTVDSSARRAMTPIEIEKSPLVLSNITFNLYIGNRVLLCGANGAGKSTLLEILAGKKRPTEGTISLLGEAPHRSSLTSVLLSASWADDISKLSSLPVKDLLESSIKTAVQRIPSTQQDKDEVAVAIRKRGVALARLLEVDAAWITTELSEGQKRRVQLATCLVYPSHLVLLDEVTAELDILTRRRLLNFLAKDCEDRNTTLIYCTHVFDGLSGFVNKVMQLSKGELLPMPPSLETGSVHAKVLDWLSSPDNTAASESLNLQFRQDRELFTRVLLGSSSAMNTAESSQSEKSDVLEAQGCEVISVKDLTWGYGSSAGGIPLFSKASFSLSSGSRCILTGSNGCGKTTLLSILGGSRLPVGYNDDNKESSIKVVGVDPLVDYSTINREVVHVSAAWRSRMRDITNGGAELRVSELSHGAIKHATQCLVSTSTAAAAVAVAVGEENASVKNNLSSSPAELHTMIFEAITRRFDYLKSILGVGEDWVMSRLSSGQKARVQLCLQLLLPSRVILMDEITAELDVDTRSKLFKFLEEESEGPLKVCILYATHVLEGLDDWFTHVLHLRKPRQYDNTEEATTTTSVQPEKSFETLTIASLYKNPSNCILLNRIEVMKIEKYNKSGFGVDVGVADRSFISDSGVLFQVCLGLLLKERDDDLKYAEQSMIKNSSSVLDKANGREDNSALSFPSSASLLRAKADERILTRSSGARDKASNVPSGWSLRTNKLPGGLGSHVWGLEEAEDLPSTSIEDDSYLPEPIPHAPIIVPPTSLPVSNAAASVSPSVNGGGSSVSGGGSSSSLSSTSESVDKERKSVTSTVPTTVLLPVLDKLEASLSSLKLALQKGDVSAVSENTSAVSMMWKLMEPALNEYTGVSSSNNEKAGVAANSSSSDVDHGASSKSSYSPFGSGPRANTMSESALISQGLILDPTLTMKNS